MHNYKKAITAEETIERIMDGIDLSIQYSNDEIEKFKEKKCQKIPVPIEEGGTEATNKASALSNLQILSSTGGDITGDTIINTKLTLKGSGNFGNKLLFSNINVGFSEPVDDALVVDGTKIYLNISSINNLYRGASTSTSSFIDQIKTAIGTFS